MLNWKKGAFSTTNKIFSEERQIGHLHDNAFKQTSDGMIRGKSYRFKTEGLFKQLTHIIDQETHEVIGSIEGNDPDDLHVLTGLFVTNYYTQVGIAVFVAVFIPIWVTVIN